MRFIVGLALLFLLISCSSSSKNKPTETGSVLYKEKCGGCHRIFKKEEFSKANWKIIFPKMETKSKLNELESKLILDYLTK